MASVLQTKEITGDRRKEAYSSLGWHFSEAKSELEEK